MSDEIQGDLLELPMTFQNRTARTEAKLQVAKSLNTSVRVVNRQKLCDKPLESVMKREKKARKALEHRENCKKLAEMVTNRGISLKKAAIEAKISQRQMARYIADILKGKENATHVQ